MILRQGRRMQYVQRIKKQIQDLRTQIQNKQITCVQILSVHQNFQNMTLSFSGPIDSPYEGYWFRVIFQWSHDYPWGKLNCKLIDQIWNPFIHFEKKQICMDILRDQRSPALMATHYVLSIISLLSQTKISHVTQGFMNPDAAIQMMKNYPLFQKHAKQICEAYSYKKQQIYTDDIRGIQQVHEIQAQQDEVDEIKSENRSSKKYDKKHKQINKLTAREMRKMNRKLKRRRQKLNQLRLKYNLDSPQKQPQIEQKVQKENNQDEKDMKDEGEEKL